MTYAAATSNADAYAVPTSREEKRPFIEDTLQTILRSAATSPAAAYAAHT